MPDGNPPTPLADGTAAVTALRAVPDRAAPEPETASVPKAAAARRYRRRVLGVLAALAAALLFYWGSSYVFAYTDDAYVTSDLVAVGAHKSQLTDFQRLTAPSGAVSDCTGPRELGFSVRVTSKGLCEQESELTRWFRFW
jgi:hypothetical protein